MAQLSAPAAATSWPCAAVFVIEGEDSDSSEESEQCSEDDRPEQVDLKDFIIYTPEIEQELSIKKQQLQQQQQKLQRQQQQRLLIKLMPPPQPPPSAIAGKRRGTTATVAKDKAVRAPPGRRRHRAEHEQEHRCERCGRTFSRRWALKVHTLGHTGDKPHKCSVCGRGFSRNSNLATHMRVHAGLKPFKCAVCGKLFSQSGSLTRHHYRTHVAARARKQRSVASSRATVTTATANYSRDLR